MNLHFAIAHLLDSRCVMLSDLKMHNLYKCKLE